MQTDQIDFEQVTAGLKTKSDKIRALSRRGVATADIARYLDIRYQHARNVLKDAGLHRLVDSEPAGPREAPRFAWVDLDASGKLVVPTDLLAAVGLEPGSVHVRLTDDGIEVLSRRAALARAQAIVAPYVPKGRSIVDEFIADRHREADRE